MEKQMNSKPNEPVRAEYNAPRAQRLSDAVQASGEDCVPGNAAGYPGYCEANGSAAHDTCVDGGVATACQTNGNGASRGCRTGGNAAECVTGNSAR